MSLICDNSHNSKFVIFQGKSLNALMCYNFLWVRRRHNSSPAVSFANCVMTLCLLRLHLQTFLSILTTKKYRILSCDNLVPNERLILLERVRFVLVHTMKVCEGSIDPLIHKHGTGRRWIFSFMSSAALLPLKMSGNKRLVDSLGPRPILGCVRGEKSLSFHYL
jgi:hypothetical protein